MPLPVSHSSGAFSRPRTKEALMDRPRLPAAPLKRVLRRLQAAEFLTWEQLADRIGVSERHLCRILMARDLSELVADRISCRIGLHPLLIWPEEWSSITPRLSAAAQKPKRLPQRRAVIGSASNRREFCQ
jgi:hypothetical protein